MCKQYNRNRKDLTALMFKKRSFTRSELIEDFARGRRGGILIDGSQTIGKYLEQLREHRILRRVGGRYEVVTS
jgi:hypothetical protein